MNTTLISPLAALPTALISGLLLALTIVRLGRGKFPAELFGAAFSVGVVMGTLVLVAEAPFDLTANPLHIPLAVQAFGFAGFPEEAAKFAGFYLFVGAHWLRRDARALVLGAAAAALGFALFEDVLYIAAAGKNWGSVAATRAATAIPLHVFLGLFAGVALARAERARTRLAAALRVAAAWIVASLLHGFYDLGFMIAAANPPYPQYVEASARSLGVNSLTLLHAVALCAGCVVVALALHSVGALGRAPLATDAAEPPVIRPNWLLRLSLARPTGWIIGALLVILSMLFVATVAVLSFIADQTDPVLIIAVPAAFLIGMALLLMRCATPRAPGERARPAWRRAGWVAAACAAALVAVAGYHWAEKPVRGVVALRLTLDGAKLAVKQDYEGAIREYDRALAMNPEFVDALANRAKVNDLLHRYDLALADFDRAVALQPENAALLLQRSQLHADMHDSAARLADLGRALALAPNNPQLLAARADAYADAGDDARAAADLAQAVALAPKSAEALMAQANAYIKSGDFDRARQSLDGAIQSNPGADNAYFERGRLSLYRGDFAKAIADLERASAVPVTPYPALWLFVSRERAGVDGGAQFTTQTRSWPSGSWPYPVVQQMLGRISAVDARAAASNDDERCEADFYNGELLLARREVDLAKSILRRALDECPRAFIEREGADAELKRLDREAAAKPPEPLPAAAAASPSPPAVQPSAAAATDASQAGAERASAVANATVSADRQYSGMATWSFVDRGADGGEVDATLTFSDAPIHGELSLRRVAAQGGPRYELLFVIRPEDRALPPFSGIGRMLGVPRVISAGSAFTSPAIGELNRVNDTTFRLVVSADEAQRFLSQLTKGDTVTMNLVADSDDRLRLELALDVKTAAVAQAAADAWR